jgi:hypothetical protein
MKPRIDYTASSRVLHHGKCGLMLISLAADGADADCQVYDGLDTNGRQVAHLEALSGTTAVLVFPEDGYLEHGLYVAVNAATSKVTVQFTPIK